MLLYMFNYKNSRLGNIHDRFKRKGSNNFIIAIIFLEKFYKLLSYQIILIS